jgi:hypothetical protein
MPWRTHLRVQQLVVAPLRCAQPTNGQLRGSLGTVRLLLAVWLYCSTIEKHVS